MAAGAPDPLIPSDQQYAGNPSYIEAQGDRPSFHRDRFPEIRRGSASEVFAAAEAGAPDGYVLYCCCIYYSRDTPWPGM